MSQGARVESIDALKVFRIAMIKFAEASNVALGDAESELQRVQGWLENEQQSYWQSQIRKRNEVLARAREALRMKKVFKDASGARQSYVDEEKAVAKATRAVEEAEQKLTNVKQWARRFQKEAAAYKGSTQRLQTFVLADVPVATAKLDRMTAALEAYVQLHGPAPSSAPAGESTAAPVSQAPPVETAKKEEGSAADEGGQTAATAAAEPAPAPAGATEPAEPAPEPAAAPSGG